MSKSFSPPYFLDLAEPRSDFRTNEIQRFHRYFLSQHLAKTACQYLSPSWCYTGRVYCLGFFFVRIRKKKRIFKTRTGFL